MDVCLYKKEKKSSRFWNEEELLLLLLSQRGERRGLHWTIRTADGLFISMWSSSSSSSLALVRAVVNIGFIFPEHHASSSSDGPLRETKDFSGFLSFILSSKYIQSLHCTAQRVLFFYKDMAAYSLGFCVFHPLQHTRRALRLYLSSGGLPPSLKVLFCWWWCTVHHTQMSLSTVGTGSRALGLFTVLWGTILEKQSSCLYTSALIDRPAMWVSDRRSLKKKGERRRSHACHASLSLSVIDHEKENESILATFFILHWLL